MSVLEALGLSCRYTCTFSRASSKNVCSFSFCSSDNFLSNQQLLEMATAIPARIARIDDKVGSLKPQMYADSFVLRGDSSRPFDAIAGAKPEDVVLVLVGGKPLYGNEKLMKPFKVPLERIDVCGKSMFLNSSALSGGPFAEVELRLRADLVGNALGLAPHAECHP
jgi:5-methylthioadenosine/S-adenosylhomocysteine deaminase